MRIFWVVGFRNLNKQVIVLTEIQKNYNYLKEALIEVESNEREFRLISSNLIEININ
jgi:hypothetical protein